MYTKTTAAQIQSIQISHQVRQHATMKEQILKSKLPLTNCVRLYRLTAMNFCFPHQQNKANPTYMKGCSLLIK